MPDNIRRMPGRPAQNSGRGASRSREKRSFFKEIFHQSGGIDIPFCCLVMILFAIGVTMLYSASYAYAAQNSSSANAFFISQLTAGAIGFVAMFIISKIDYRILNGIITPIAFFGTMAILCYTLIVNHDKAIKRWIYIAGRQFQPSEIAKFVMILTLAYMICILHRPIALKEKGKRITPNLRGLTTFEKLLFKGINTQFKSMVALAAVILMFTVLVVLESHLSCAILLFLLGVSMMWISGIDKKWFVLLGIAAAGMVTLVIIKPEIVKIFSTYGYERVVVWLKKESFGQTTYWQTQQGLWAIASGGPFGVGFGRSVQKQLYIPEPQNDFIFPVVIEELGFVGAAIILLLFAALIFRGFVIATKSRDLFGSVLVTGIMLQLGLQVLINIAVVTDIFPNTGIALPFFSYGGTALVILLCEMGVVLSVSRRVVIKSSAPKEGEVVRISDLSADGIN